MVNIKSPQEMLKLERALLKLENLHASFDYLRVSIASPKRIKSWAQRSLPNGEVVGEVLKPESINFRTYEPEDYGLFCEMIFGPIKNWKCRCGKYTGFALDKICDECYVEIIESRVRRYRMGYIDLICPVTHLWYLKGSPSYLTILLRCFDEDLSVKQIEQIVYFREEPEALEVERPLYRFLHHDRNTKKNQDKISLDRRLKIRLGLGLVDRERMGSEILKAALENINVSLEIKKARSLVDRNSEIDFRNARKPKKHIIRQIRILESFLSTKTNPAWMILSMLPILPPTLRPLVELENGLLVSADINEMYRLVIVRNQRLSDFLYVFVAPNFMSTQNRKLLQEGVDSLIDNARLPKNKMLCVNDRPLKSLTEILEGKQGRFRQSLLGKRVDYSGRSVIIVGPTLELSECGLPYEMAAELFQPFLISALLKTKMKAPSHNIRLAHQIIKKNKPFVWTLLKALTHKHCILLNRAPTLHRFGIQAFTPRIVLGQAIHLHPLVCTGFNADFDGDQMAVHLPLYESSQLEAYTMMRPIYNILSPSNGEVILKPTQDMVIGCYYLTLMFTKKNYQIQNWFANESKALAAFYNKKIVIHTPILVRYCLKNFRAVIFKNYLFLSEHLNSFLEKRVKLYKIFKVGNNNAKCYLITDIGIFLAHSQGKDIYVITDFFLETTPGRLIFSLNFKNIIAKK